jgi:hypothetical protein
MIIPGIPEYTGDGRIRYIDTSSTDEVKILVDRASREDIRGYIDILLGAGWVDDYPNDTERMLNGVEQQIYLKKGSLVIAISTLPSHVGSGGYRFLFPRNP